MTTEAIGIYLLAFSAFTLAAWWVGWVWFLRRVQARCSALAAEVDSQRAMTSFWSRASCARDREIVELSAELAEARRDAHRERLLRQAAVELSKRHRAQIEALGGNPD